jgi:Outer membrane receptor for ferrienterochelin and colicins
VYGEKVDNKNPGNSNPITSESNAVDGKYVLPLGDINQLMTFGGEWRHDKLKDPVNLTGGSEQQYVDKPVCPVPGGRVAYL